MPTQMDQPARSGVNRARYDGPMLAAAGVAVNPEDIPRMACRTCCPVSLIVRHEQCAGLRCLRLMRRAGGLLVSLIMRQSAGNPLWTFA